MLLESIVAVSMFLAPQPVSPSGNALWAISNDGCVVSVPADIAVCEEDWGPGDPGLGIVAYRHINADPSEWVESGTI